MSPKFEVLFLEDARQFLLGLELKVRTKIIYNLDKSRFINDPRLFKKLNSEVWEFRTKYGSVQYRLFAFWDKTQSTRTLVVATHGMIKTSDKIPLNELNKAAQLRAQYFRSKNV